MTAASPFLLCARGVRKAFGSALALRGAGLEVAAGEIHALVGENGAGKSTLMHILGGSLRPDAGDIEFQGKPWRPSGPGDARNCGVTLVLQEPALAPHLDVEANLTLGRERSAFGFVRPQSARVREVLDQLGYGNLSPHALVGSLGVAERQILEIARALFAEAKLILMDEPTSSLPARDVDRLFSALARLKARGVSVIYISHFLDEVAKVADRITVLRDGETAAAGLPGDAPAAVILKAMAGRTMEEYFPARRAEPGPIAMQVENWRSRAEAAPVSFPLRRGQILGIAGLVGSGRSSLLRSLYGLRSPAEGSLSFADARVTASGWNVTRARAAGLGFLSEDRKEEGLALGMSVRANATLGQTRRFQGPLGFLRLRAEAAAVRDLAASLSLRWRDPDQSVAELSGGNQQKVALGRLLLGGAAVWLLDEPTRGVDVGAKAEIYRLIAAEAAAGKAVIWSGSYLPELFGVCDSLAVMHRGRLSPIRPIADWTEASVLAWATTGSDREGTMA